MKVLDLFSGIGGFSLGLERAGMQTVAFCEIEKFPQEVLRKHWPEVPIYEDIRKLTAERLREDSIGAIDVICGGFPCQPFSFAGQQRGTEDHRDLWPEMFRLIQECKPTWVIGENVAGFIDMAFERTALDLESAGYEVQPVIIPACAVGAPHRRDRVWIIAHANRQRCGSGGDYRKERHLPANGEWHNQETQPDRQQLQLEHGTDGTVYAHTYGEGLQIRIKNPLGEVARNPEPERQSSVSGEWQFIKPAVCGDNHGIPRRVDRIKALGNAVVPQIPEIIGRAIMNNTTI